MRVFSVPGQAVRIIVLIVVAFVSLLVVRGMFVPESFGEIGHYRADALPVIMDQEIHYAGLPACAECHDDVAEAKAASYHRGLTCEGCHDAAARHVEDPTEISPTMPAGRDSCVRCHAYLPSRPTGFPQIIEQVHSPMEPCGSCHDPHDPTPPEVPSECSACHAEIARTKSVSHHWSLGCETCHEAQAEHSENPRAYLPKKPIDRQFCGGCHSRKGGVATGAPGVDMAEHGGRYLCWQCHYPHDPEGRQ